MRLLNKAALVVLALLVCVLPAQAQQAITSSSVNILITADADYVEFPIPNNIIGGTIDITGYDAGTLTFESTSTGSWTQNRAMRVVDQATGDAVTTATANGAYNFSNQGYTHIRVIGSGGITGSASIRVTRGFGGSISSEVNLDLGEAMITVGAQPADDPHFVQCSNGTIASPCLVGDGAGALNVIVDSGAITATVTDGAGALNVIVDSGALTVSDGAGALNVIVDSGALTVSDGAGALNVILDSAPANLDVQIGGSDTVQVQSNSLSLVPGLAEDDPHVSTEAGALIFGVRQDAQVDFGADGDRVPFSIDADGNLRVAFSGMVEATIDNISLVDIGDDDISIDAANSLRVTLVDDTGAVLTQDTQATHATTLGTITDVTGSVLMGNASTATPTDVGADGDAAAIWLTRSGAVNVADAGGSLTVDGTVTVTDGAGALNTIVDSGTLTAVTTITNPVTITDGAGVINVIVDSITAGNSNIGDVDIASIAAGTNNIGKVSNTAVTTGGCTWNFARSAGAVLETQVKGTAGQVYAVQAYSLDATPVWIKWYNDTGANVDETDTPIAITPVPSNATAANLAGNNFSIDVGSAFSTAITYRVTTGQADNDTGALTANEVFVNVCYL